MAESRGLTQSLTVSVGRDECEVAEHFDGREGGGHPGGLNEVIGSSSGTDGGVSDAGVFRRRISIALEREDMRGALDLFREARERGFAPDAFEYSAALSAFARLQQPENVAKLFAVRVVKGLEPVEDIWELVLKENAALAAAGFAGFAEEVSDASECGSGCDSDCGASVSVSEGT